MEQAQLQVQDISGNWISVGSTMNQPQMISKNLDSLARVYKKTVRAIDSNGNILQLRTLL